MSDPFIGEIKMFSFNYAPRDWAACDGQLLAINQNQALFSLLGTAYGGNGTTTFALPNLRGRTPVHVGAGVTRGQAGGEEAHALTVSEIPAHTHLAMASTALANQTTAAGYAWGETAVSTYHPQANTTMSASAISGTGDSAPHENRQPYLAVNFCIALMGIYPSQN